MGDELGLDLERLLRQRGWMRALARGLVSEGEVDDLVQESWLAALTAHSLPRSSVRAWFAGLARNAARGLRRVRDGEERECDALADGSAASSELLARAELQERLIAAVRSLREPERSTVLLCYFEELPLAEVARRMGVPGSTARTRHARALAELRERIGRERGDAWGLVVALARGGAPGITTTAMEATLMGMLAKVTVAAVAAAGIALVVWTKLEVPEERARVVHEAPPAPLLAESPRSETPAVEAHAEVEPRVPADSPADAKHDDPPAPPAPAPSIAASPLERRLEQVADSFLTEDPDVAGLVALSDALAGAVSVLPDSLEVHESGSVSGKFEAIGNLQGTFSCRSGRAAPEYSVELGSWNTGVPFPRVLRLEFSEEDGVLKNARILLTSHPMKEASPSLGGQEWTGWRAEIDGDGARAHRTSMRIDDPAPSADHYLYEIGDVQDVEPRKMPWITTGALDPWLTRLRALRPR